MHQVTILNVAVNQSPRPGNNGFPRNHPGIKTVHSACEIKSCYSIQDRLNGTCQPSAVSLNQSSNIDDIPRKDICADNCVLVYNNFRTRDHPAVTLTTLERAHELERLSISRRIHITRKPRTIRCNRPLGDGGITALDTCINACLRAYSNILASEHQTCTGNI